MEKNPTKLDYFPVNSDHDGKSFKKKLNLQLLFLKKT